MIGHLQTNKVKYIIDFVDLIHAVDSIRLMEEIDSRAAKIGRVVDCLLQVHIAQEDQKFGFEKEALMDLITEGAFDQFEHLKIKGFMGMATFTEDKEQVKKEFEELKNIYDSIVELKSDKTLDMNIISMGMSGDYSLAIEQGSTMVRIGSSIFGTRN